MGETYKRAADQRHEQTASEFREPIGPFLLVLVVVLVIGFSRGGEHEDEAEEEEKWSSVVHADALREWCPRV